MCRPHWNPTLFPYTTLFRSNIDVESVAALVPSIVSAADEFGRDSTHGTVTTVILEYARGIAIVSVLSAEAVLLVLARRSEEHTSELQSLAYLVCRLLLEKKK